MDENGSQGSEQLSMASRSERHNQVLVADLREIGVCRNLQMEKLHETGGYALNVHSDGQYHDALRKNREAAWENSRVPRTGLHHCRQVGIVRVRARRSDFVGRQSVGRRVSIPFTSG